MLWARMGTWLSEAMVLQDMSTLQTLKMPEVQSVKILLPYFSVQLSSEKQIRSRALGSNCLDLITS